MCEPMWDYEDLKKGATEMMPAGTYFVGDLCYVMNDRWDEVCDKIISKQHRGDGEFVLNDSVRFASYGTRWGDGCYEDQNGCQYGVDAGIIGCISMNDVDMDIRGTRASKDRGNFGGWIIDFPEPFTTWSENGVIHIGHITIDTN